MDFNLANKIKDKESSWIDFALYFAFAFLLVVIISSLALEFKVYMQKQKVSDMDKVISAYDTDDNKKAEKEVLDYKKKIGDFNSIIVDRKISSNVFSFIESNTLPKVWFLNFDMSESKNNIKLSGETDNMVIFSRQLGVFENSDRYVKSVNILSSEVQSNGKVRFILDIYLDPNIFNYTNIFFPTAVN